MRISYFTAALAVAAIASSPVAAAFPTGSWSDPQPAQPAPAPAPVRTVTIGDYCASTYAPTTTVAQTSTGQTVYCVQVKGTDAYVWWPVDHVLPVDPHRTISAGDYCLEAGDIWGDGQGRKMFCKPSSGGRLTWQLPR